MKKLLLLLLPIASFGQSLRISDMTETTNLTGAYIPVIQSGTNKKAAASLFAPAFISQTANTFFAAPNGLAGLPSFRPIVPVDIPTLNQNTTGSSGSVANPLSISAELISGGASSYNGSVAKSIGIQPASVTNAMLAGGIDLTTKVTGILQIANGGTGSSTQNWWGLSGSSTLTGVSTIISNAPSQHIFNGSWTATANNQNHIELAGTITSRNIASDNFNYLVIDPTLIRNVANPANQTATAVLINPTFSNSPANTWGLGVNGNVFVGTATPVAPVGNVTKLQVNHNDSGGGFYTAYFKNTSSAGQTSYYLDNSRGDFASYGGFLIGGATNVFDNLFGLSRADRLFMFADGASSLGMAVGTLTGQPFYIGTNNTERARFTGATGNFLIGSTTDNARLYVTQGALSSSWVPSLRIDAGAHTSMTASTEQLGSILKISAATQQWATGALATQRFNYFGVPTIAFVGASTATDVYNVYVEAPVAGTNAIVTNKWAAGFNGITKFESRITTTYTSILAPLTIAAGSNNPSSPTQGDIYFNTTSLGYKFYDGSVWQNISGSTAQIDNYFSLSEDFVTNAPSQNFFAFSNGGGLGSPPAVSQVGVDNTNHASGVQVISTGTSTAGGSAIYDATYTFTFGFGFTYTLIYRMSIGALSNGTDTYKARVGFIDNATTTVNNGAYFRYTDAVNAGKWQAVTVSGGVETATDTGITATITGWHIFKIVTDPAAANVLFYIDGTLVATNTTNIINSSSNVTGKGITIEKTLGSTARQLYVDYLQFTSTRTAAR